MGCGHSNKINIYPRKSRKWKQQTGSTRKKSESPAENADSQEEEDGKHNNDRKYNDITGGGGGSGVGGGGGGGGGEICEGRKPLKNKGGFSQGTSSELLTEAEIIANTQQDDFFKMLDEKIEMGPDYNADSENEILAEQARLRTLMKEWEMAASVNSGSQNSINSTPKKSPGKIFSSNVMRRNNDDVGILPQMETNSKMINDAKEYFPNIAQIPQSHVIHQSYGTTISNQTNQQHHKHPPPQPQQQQQQQQQQQSYRQPSNNYNNPSKYVPTSYLPTAIYPPAFQYQKNVFYDNLSNSSLYATSASLPSPTPSQPPPPPPPHQQIQQSSHSYLPSSPPDTSSPFPSRQPPSTPPPTHLVMSTKLSKYHQHSNINSNANQYEKPTVGTCILGSPRHNNSSSYYEQGYYSSNSPLCIKTFNTPIKETPHYSNGKLVIQQQPQQQQQQQQQHHHKQQFKETRDQFFINSNDQTIISKSGQNNYKKTVSMNE